MKWILFCCCLWMIYGCGNSVSNSSPEEERKPVDEVKLVGELTRHLIANPKTQPEKDQNEMVNYAIDQMLDLNRTASGMYYQIIKEGKGSVPEYGSTVVAHYEGKLLDGTVFDSSYEKGEPLTIPVYQSIRGWQEGLKLMKPGGKALFLIPSRLAYGKEGFGKKIPANAPLLFKMELVAIK